MKKIITTVILLLAIVNLFAKSNNVVTLTCSGSAKTEAEAINIALRSAIEQTYGAFISSNTRIINDKLVKDEIVSISNGNIQGYDKIAVINHPNGDISVTLRATVSINKLVDFAVSNGTTVNFDGSTYAMNVKMAKLRQENTFKAFSNLCDQVEEMCPRAFDWYIRMETPKANAKDVTVTVELIPNSVTVEIYQLISKTLRSLSLSKSDFEMYRELGVGVLIYTNPSLFHAYDSAVYHGYAHMVESPEIGNEIVLPCEANNAFYIRQQQMYDNLVMAMKNYELIELHTDQTITKKHTLYRFDIQGVEKVERDEERYIDSLEDLFNSNIWKTVNWEKWGSAYKVIDTKSIKYEYVGSSLEYLYKGGLPLYKLDRISEQEKSVGKTLAYLEKYHPDDFNYLYRTYVPEQTKNNKKPTGNWSKKAETLLEYIPTKGVTIYTWTHSIPAETVKYETFTGFKLERKETEFKKETDETDIDNDIFDFLGI